MDRVGATGTSGTPADAGGKGGAVSWVARRRRCWRCRCPWRQRRDLRHHGRQHPHGRQCGRQWLRRAADKAGQPGSASEED